MNKAIFFLFFEIINNNIVNNRYEMLNRVLLYINIKVGVDFMNLINLIKNIMIFNPPEKDTENKLKENEKREDNNPDSNETKNEPNSTNLKILNKSKTKKEENNPNTISKNLSSNLEFIKNKYSVPINSDLYIREFKIVYKKSTINAFIVFFDGLSDRSIINEFILEPLMLLSNYEVVDEDLDLMNYIKNHLLPQNQLKITGEISEVIEEINFGGCGIFVDSLDVCFAADVKGWEHRGVDKPISELVIRGPQEGFNEVIRTNTALVRKILKDEDLIVENISVGRRSKTPCAMLYIKDIANTSLIDDVRNRIESLNIDYIIDSGELEQLIEDSTFSPFPQIISTERPDRVASQLSEGRIAIILHGSPFALVVPATLSSLLHTPEDIYSRFPFGNFIRVVRIIGILLTLLLPGLYIAIINYHQEMIPTELLFSIEAAREKVPFPSVLELLIMESSFELIREAGIRIPGPIGPTLGIIGGLILGQAAVAASIVSPILIIIVAVTGIGSFAIPNFSLGFSFRLLRFAYIILGALSGLLGITVGLFINGLLFVNAKSFGVPFMSPFGPRSKKVLNDELTRAPIWKMEKRPDYLNTKDENEQSKISRGWTLNKKDRK